MVILIAWFFFLFQPKCDVRDWSGVVKMEPSSELPLSRRLAGLFTPVIVVGTGWDICLGSVGGELLLPAPLRGGGVTAVVMAVEEMCCDAL